jgi:hypothetical protein
MDIVTSDSDQPHQIVAQLLKEYNYSGLLEPHQKYTVLRGENQSYDEPLSTGYALNNEMNDSPMDIARDEWAMAIEWHNKMREAGFNSHLRNDWEILVEAQHFGLQTRLLDWSFNPLMALWIAADGHARAMCGLSYEEYFESDRKEGFVYIAALPYQPVLIDGHDGVVRINGTPWNIRKADSNELSYSNPILASHGHQHINPSFETAGSPTPHSHYKIPGDDKKYGMLFFEMASKFNNRVRAQSGLFSIHAPANFRLNQKSDRRHYNVRIFMINSDTKRRLLKYLEEVLNCNAASFGLETPDTIAKGINKMPRDK